MDLTSLEERAILWGGTVFYTVAFVYAMLFVARGRKYCFPVFYALLAAGFILQSLGLYVRGLHVHVVPVNNVFEILQVIGWSAVLLEFIIRPTFGIRLLGFFTAGLAAVLGLVSLGVTGWDVPGGNPVDPVNPWTGFHAALAIFSYGVFALLALTALMYLIQHYALEHKRIGGLFSRLPAIRQLEEINARLLMLGFSIFTVSVAIGLVNWLEAGTDVGTGKLVAALLLWVGYLGVQVQRQRKRLLGARFAWACLILFLFALLVLWPVNESMPHMTALSPMSVQPLWGGAT